MPDLRLELPTLQNWSCHNCSDCCRQHLIEVTEEERRRITEEQDWTEADGIPAGQPLVVPMSRLPWNKQYRLAHQSDGSCVFLNEQGLCRIHAKYGEAAKPLPCRLYPYVFHPAGRKTAVSLRFSCPSVVANKGRAVSEQGSELKKLGRQVVPENVQDLPPPEVAPKQQVDWPDFRRFVDRLDAALADVEVPLTVRLLRTLFWMDLVGQSQFDNVRGNRLDEFLELVTQAAASEVPGDPADMEEPTRPGRTQFRMLVAQYARRDTLADLESGWRGRWKLLRAALRFAAGTGTVPPLQDRFREVPFETLEQPFGALPGEADEILTRYFRVKVQGMHFCGVAYYGVPLVEGFQSLALIYPVILWLARWLAAGKGRQHLTVDDISQAVTVADHHHGYSPALGQSNARRRVRLLAQTGDIGRLCARYGR